ncbi:MAG: GspH/FimT family pseudopilin [Azonexus sp.]|nr:GspH/FimT family pseudopilin [Azonexus sp.]MCK6413671.1 GspH/FimT family pseudopilin [Azonexus sp.]
MLTATPLPCQRGLSMVEVMVVVAIMAALMATGMPSFMEWVQNTQIRTAAETLAAGLQSARTEALRRNTPVEFILTGNGGLGETGWEVRLRNTEQLLQSQPAGEGSAKAQLTTVPDDARRVTFNGLGRVDISPPGRGNSDGSPTLTQLNIDNPSLAAEKSRDLRIVIGAGGSIRMCDPAVSGSDTRACP